MTNPIKVYVSVKADFRSDGTLFPRVLIWEDGREFDIDRVLKVRQAPAVRAGGQGDRYTIMVGGQEKYLFFERNPDITGNNLGRWFVERK
ncbi:MAG: hypothetical protein PHX51_02135 [Clostridia bacterium]|nr:hypothetical protein [Clostridia bacterium]